VLADRMSKKRGLSAEEKRTRMLDLFYEKKEFFLLKELERIAPKEKGIVSQSVKDVVQSLVDDDLVDTDKIGTSVYFWAFPSKATAVRKRKLEEVQAKLEEADKKVEASKASLVEATKGREESQERTETLQRLDELKAKKAALEAEVQKFKDCDPELIDQLRREIQLSKDSANRWTDNIFSLHSWIQKKFPAIHIPDLNKQFGIPDDIDYVE